MIIAASAKQKMTYVRPVEVRWQYCRGGRACHPVTERNCFLRARRELSLRRLPQSSKRRAKIPRLRSHHFGGVNPQATARFIRIQPATEGRSSLRCMPPMP